MFLTTFYELAKDIIIPILSPVLTALTILLFVWQEKKKANLQTKANLKFGADSVLRDLMFFREAYQLFGLMVVQKEPVTDERIKHLKDTFNKIQENLTHNPDLFNEYLADYSGKNNLTLLLIELQVKINSLTKTSNIDNFILFGVYNFLFVFSNNPSQIAETKKILESIRQTNPDLYDSFIVAKKDNL
jgi:hypothetical protein